MRVSALHPDVVVATSAIWQTNCTLVRHGGEAFCIDSPVLPGELESLPALASQAGFSVVGLLVTHADWDHVLARYAFAEAALACAASSADRLRIEVGGVQRELREFDDEHYVSRPSPLTLPAPQVLPVPGHCDVGEAELELHPAEGHTPDGMAVLVPWAGVLVVGDYLSPVEIPIVVDREAYVDTLDRFAALLARVEHVVPGHGMPIGVSAAAEILAADRAYVEGLPDAPLPRAARSRAQRAAHERNVAAVQRRG